VFADQVHHPAEDLAGIERRGEDSADGAKDVEVGFVWLIVVRTVHALAWDQLVGEVIGRKQKN
jgi:hypothetical protein